MRSIICAGVEVTSKGKLMSTSRRLPASVARRMSSTLRSLNPSRPSFFAKAVHARDRNVGARGKFLNGKPADVFAHGKGRDAELLLGGGEALRLGDLAFDIHANSHTRQTCQKGTGLFWHVSAGIRKCQGQGGGSPWARKEVSGLARPLLPVPRVGDTRLIDPRCKGDAHPTSTTGKGLRFEPSP